MLVRLRATMAVRALQWPLSSITLVGVTVSSLSVLTWTIHNAQLQCDLRLWTWVLGTAAMFLPLASAFLRIHLIVANTSLQATPDTSATPGPTWRRRLVKSARVVLVGGQLLLFLVFLVPTLAWHVASPFRLAVVVVDPIRPLFNVHECISDGWTTFGVALAALLLVLLLVISTVSWSVRRVHDTRFHRFRAVMTASFVCVLILGVTAVFQSTASASVSRAFLFGMRSILVLLSNLVYLVLLFASPLADAVGQSRASHGVARRPLAGLAQMTSLPEVAPAAAAVDVVVPLPAHIDSSEPLASVVPTSSAVVLHLSATCKRPLSLERDPPPTCAGSD